MTVIMLLNRRSHTFTRMFLLSLSLAFSSWINGGSELEKEHEDTAIIEWGNATAVSN
jgi:hypothetical protein